MKFVPVLSVERDVPEIQKETPAYDIYSCWFGTRLHPLGELNKNTIEAVGREHINELTIFSSDIKHDFDLSLLTAVPELEALYLHIEKPIDWTPLQRLTNLQRLTLIARGYEPPPLDFTRFRKLHTVRLSWHEAWNSVLSCKSVRSLTIEDSSKIPEFDLRQLQNLKELCLTECRGLRKVRCNPSHSLQSLGIASCRSFEGFEPPKVLKTLEYVMLGGDSHFDIEALGNCPELKRLSMFGTGKLPSLSFLRNCRKVNRIAMHGSTKIEDGDLNLLTKWPLRYVSFRRFRNYTHTLDQIKQHHKI